MIQRITVMRLALGLGLAAWLCVAYWLYATRIYPRLHPAPETSGPAISGTLPYPMAFSWGSDDPLIGRSITDLRAGLSAMHALDQVGIVEGFYYLDEATTHEERLDLARRRIQRALALLPVPADRIIAVIRQAEIRADVRTHPFEAVRLRLIDLSTLLFAGDNTLEVCFPVREEIALPAIMHERIREWGEALNDVPDRRLVITGLADTVTNAVPADLAAARALSVAVALEQAGWDKEGIEIATAARSMNDPMRSTCVILKTE